MKTKVSLKMHALMIFHKGPAICGVGHAAWLHNIYCKSDLGCIPSSPQHHRVTLSSLQQQRLTPTARKIQENHEAGIREAEFLFH